MTEKPLEQQLSEARMVAIIFGVSTIVLSVVILFFQTGGLP